MNPADTEALGQAIASQGTLLGQHDQALKDIMDCVRELSTDMHAIRERISPLAPPVAPSQPSVSYPVPGSPPSHREPSVPAPERYGGDLGTCRAFLVQCSLVFEQQRHTYATHRSRISYLIASLKGAALAWASAVWEEQSKLCFDYDDFTQEMKKVFDHPVRGKDAARHLLSLQQGSRSVAEFAIEFRTLAAESGWNDEALQGVFQNALSDNLKDELVSREEPGSLDQLISLAIRVDNRLRERRRERSSKSQVPFPFPLTASRRLPTRSFQPLQDVPGSAEPEPMQLGRAGLTPEERAHRFNSKACLYCGQVGHFIFACPIRPVKDSARR